MLNDKRKIVVSTGNILNTNKKAGQKTTEELFDCLNLTVSDPIFDVKSATLSRNNDDLLAKVTEFERKNIKIGAKVFLNHSAPEYLHEAINSLLQVLQVDHLDNLILVYHPVKSIDETNGETNGKTNGTIDTKLSNGHQNKASLAASLPKETVLSWSDNENAVHELKQLWLALESYANDKRICQLGIADLDTETLIDLYQSCRIKPTIAQINLSACCVVPPSMQEFCTRNEIQLLTHSDSEEIVSKQTFRELDSDILQSFNPIWTSRYQVHIKCRGVLTAKGFTMGVERD